MTKRLILFIAIVLGFCFQGNSQVLTDTVMIHFRQSHVNLDTTYMDNASALGHARELIRLYQGLDSTFVLKNVQVVGAASPEGSVDFNEWLSQQRAKRIFDCIGEEFTLPDSLTTFTFLGRDWNGLRRMVAADTGVPYRTDVLAVVDDIISSLNNGKADGPENVARLKRLHGGEPYLYMYYNIFPDLRASRLVLTFEHTRPQEQLPTIDIPAVDINPTIFVPAISEPKQLKPFYMALKTNLLYDALAAPEISAEFYLGKNFSIVGNWMYGWWDKDSAHKYWRIYGGDIALRWWFGKKAHQKPLTGHHIGIYCGVITYDFEFGGRGYMGGKPGRPLWDRFEQYYGVEYGYSLPIAKRLNIDFNFGIGYLGGKVLEYVPMGKCYVWQNTKYRRWFGPTKAEISLVWLIGRGNVNKKGGAR